MEKLATKKRLSRTERVIRELATEEGVEFSPEFWEELHKDYRFERGWECVKEGFCQTFKPFAPIAKGCYRVFDKCAIPLACTGFFLGGLGAVLPLEYAEHGYVAFETAMSISGPSVWIMLASAGLFVEEIVRSHFKKDLDVFDYD